MRPEDIDARVKDVVRAWARAKDVEASAKVLAAGRAELPPELRPQLVSEIAEISAELMVDLLCRTDGLDPEAEPVDVQGEPLDPKQAERLGAWAEDQQRTARALGLEPKAWLDHLGRGFERYGDKARGESAGADETDAPLAADPRQAKRLLGVAKASFEARPDPSQSTQAGLSGLLAARAFGKGKKKP